MFNTLGKVGAGCFVVFLAIWLLPALLIGVPNAGGVIGVLILGVAVALGVKNWERIKAMLASEGPPARPALGLGMTFQGPPLAVAQPSLEQLAAEVEALTPRLPADPLDNPQLVEISHLYLHEPLEERLAVEHEYDTARQRLLRAQADVEQLGTALVSGRSPVTSDECRRLEAELTAVRQYLAELDDRAREAPALPERALATAARAARAVVDAEAALDEVSAAHPTEELAARLGMARATLRQVDEAVREDAPRPLTAIRLGEEVIATATDVRDQALGIPRIAEHVRRRPSEFEATSARVAGEIEAAKALVESVSEDYAPSCWHEIRGEGAAAEQALRRARQLWAELGASPSDVDGAESPASILAEMDAPFAALEKASRHARAITDHVARLRAASAGARGAVERAEAAVDLGWAAVAADGATDGTEVLERAGKLVAEARALLGAAQTDPLTVIALAERAQALAGAVESRDSSEPVAIAAREVDAEGARQVLLAMMTRAKASRDRALALSWTTSADALSSSTTVLIDRAEGAYQAALQREAAISQVEGGDALATAINEATVAFRTADELAAAAYKAGWQEISAPSRRADSESGETLKSGLIAGAAAAVIVEIFGGQ